MEKRNFVFAIIADGEKLEYVDHDTQHAAMDLMNIMV